MPPHEISTRLASELGNWSPAQINLIREQIAPKATDAELALFLNVAKSSGLDPFRKQIYAIHRRDSRLGRDVMAIQTGIDGYRLIAERSGLYVGNDDPVFVEGDPYPRIAKVTVWKLVGDQPRAFTASARWREYYPGEGGKGSMWRRMPHVMLGKVAEALALRKAFPGDLSGLYTHEELDQAQDPIHVEARVVDRKGDELEEAHRRALGWVGRLSGDARKRGSLRVQQILKIESRAERLAELNSFSQSVQQVFDEAKAKGASGRQQKQSEAGQQGAGSGTESPDAGSSPPADPPPSEPDPDWVAQKENAYRAAAKGKGLPDEDVEAELKRCNGNPTAIERSLEVLATGGNPAAAEA